MPEKFGVIHRNHKRLAPENSRKEFDLLFSVDPDAKIIFGTVKDERLKKNELKITVIASGFSDISNKKSLFTNIINTNKEKEEDKKTKLFSFGGSNSEKEEKVEVQQPIKEQAPIVEDKKATHTDFDDDSDWGAVPAFLRRQKK